MHNIPGVGSSRQLGRRNGGPVTRHSPQGKPEPAAGPAVRRAGAASALGSADPSLTAVDVWLQSNGRHVLAVTGPVGIGKTRLLDRIAAHLSAVGGLTVVAADVGTAQRARHLIQRVGALSSSLAAEAPEQLLVAVVDHADRLPADERSAVLDLVRCRGVRLIVTATYEGQLEEVVTLPVPALAGRLDLSVADLDSFQTSEVVREFVQRLRRHNPAFAIDPAGHGQIARLCAASFGIPKDLDLLADLVDRVGLGAVHSAVAERGSRRYLGDLVGDLGADRPELSAEEMVILAAIAAAPGGASANMLRQSLPRCDIDGSTTALLTRGMIVRTSEPEKDRRGVTSRYHLRVSAAHVANWCVSQPDVSAAAIRHAHADYLQGLFARMATQVHSSEQRAVFAEFQHELPNLQATVSDLIDTGRHPQVVSLLTEALPMLARSGGLAQMLPDLLRLIRDYDPTADTEIRLVAVLAAEIFLAAGEHEVAAIYLDQIRPEAATGADPAAAGSGSPTDLRISYLRAVANDAAEGDLATMAHCITTASRNRTSAQWSAEAAGEYIARLVQRGELERAEDACRTALWDVTRNGDGYAAGVVLLWRAVVWSGSDPGRARQYAERGFDKLRPLGISATLSALAALINNRNLRGLDQYPVDMAMLTGTLSRAGFASAEANATHPPVIPQVEQRLIERIGPSAVRRWAEAGACTTPADLLCEIVKRRWVDRLDGAVELRQGGVIWTDPVPPGALGESSALTARECEVASLVATGLTNKQVAFRLQISEWTVVNHLRQIMRKLDCTSRVQVARWVSDVQAQAGDTLASPASTNGRR